MKASMSDFDLYMNDYQTAWRSEYLANQEEGSQLQKKHSWVLPRELWEEGLWSGIRNGHNSLPAYLIKEKVQKHDGVHNLKSSWMQCANLYFPFREDREILASFLQKYISPLIKTIDKVELEWAEDSPMLSPTALLGEPQGQRGKNQTSPDIAFIVNDGKGIVLTENKFTEHSFYTCSGYKKAYGNPDSQRCLELDKLYGDTTNRCYMFQWAKGKRTNRNYWNYLKLTEKGIATLKSCPAATAGYQLFRQQALAEALAQKGPYELVVSCVAYDARNITLVECLKNTGIDNFTTGWGSLFEGKVSFTTFTHQQWVQWVRENDYNNRHTDWLTYVHRRYGF